MATIATALDTTFTPAVGDFIAQANGNPVVLLRRNAAGAPWSIVQTIVNQPVVVSNPIAGAQYMFTAPQPVGTTVQADQ